MIKYILFDLDGTLLPMDNDAFVKGYLDMLAKKMVPLGYEPEAFIKALWYATGKVCKNDGTEKNEIVFWKNFSGILGERCLKDITVFDEFYERDFRKAQQFCGFNSKVKDTIELCNKKGLKCILATNPVFPAVATIERIKWAGLKTEDFIYYSTYENSSFCKPNPKYYLEIAENLNLNPRECLMVGNDADEDAAAEQIGMKVFLLTDYLINRNDKDISNYPKGNFDDLEKYINEL